MRFKAANGDNWAGLEGRSVRLNSKGHAQLRIEAIDTLETHYDNQHQPLQFANAAALQLFALLGIRDVVWNASRSRVTSAKDGAPGFIISRATERNGRPVAFVFGPIPGLVDGQEVYLDAKLAKQSVNYLMLKAGLAYPTFYDGLFYDLREAFALQTAKARKKKRGLWAVDVTNNFTEIRGLADVADVHVLLPKLFRRIAAYFETSGGTFDAAQFVASLKQGRERVLVLNKLHFTHFDNLVEVDAEGKIRLTEKPEELVFLA